MASYVIMGMMALVLSLATSLWGYNVSEIDVNFDCGNLGNTMSQICDTFPTRVSRSVQEPETKGKNSDEPSDSGFHPRSLNLAHVQETIGDLLISPEMAHSYVKSLRKSRAKRSLINVQDECCNHVTQHRCNAEEILEYCHDRNY